MIKLQEAFEKEMTKQGRSIKRLANGAYEDYASAIMWSWAQWGYEQRDREVRGAMA